MPPSSQMQVDLTGQSAIVTGAGSGIGRSIAETLAQNGAKVVVHDIDGARAETVADTITQQGGIAHPVVADIADEDAVTAMVAETMARWGRIDICCNNAGILDDLLPVHRMSTALWDRVIAVNLTGPFLLTRAVLPIMQAQHHGVIVNTSSVAGLRGGISGSAYSTAKTGLIGLTKSVAWTYSPDGVRCNAICPGLTDTDIAKGKDFKEFDLADVGRLVPIMSLPQRKAAPQEIANLVLFLASDAASFINGTIIPVDDGLSAG
ncbi:3-oxoacyl-ACP reductase FabG [Sphingobium phenoxybenzoativorans]|uniref:3-oxoacyl-ACP reductase FabG n=1 Tax=Sphingobium phenoxybenzoativorans TaxID=1592790 RepID=A0A975KAJ3_9SPHN|nr:3-oxoacyl-ACP reductase FabG [Sphingobium phenoxybenzoativorans]QUT07844.1 3-oxoacyl-ACP reductase FabG [Sphingobium phenoxybenzoativorans]